MKISLGTNWDPALIQSLAKYDQIEDVYAKLAVDIVGGGRPSYVIPDVDRKQVVTHTDACHASGIQITYLLNRICVC